MALQDRLPLDGKVALVTGAGRNIGRSIALALAGAGATVAVNGRSDREAVDATVAEIQSAGGRALGLMADVADPAQVDDMANRLRSDVGRLDVLVSNAGLRRQTPFLEMSFEEWREIMSVALDGAFLLCRAAVPLMVESGDGGTIVTLSGVSNHIGTLNRVHVNASKAGLEGLTRGLARELAPHAITVNAVAPGMIDTVRGASAGSAPGALSPEVVPLGRKGAPEEIAAMVLHLASPLGRYVTGQTIHVNGGAFLT